MKWIELIYSETDFGKSIATALSGIIGLGVYFYTSDWVIAAFSMIISFPLMHLIANYFHNKIDKKSKKQSLKEKTDNFYSQLSDTEKQVIKGFLDVDSSVLTWKQFNQMSLPSPGCETLLQRGILRTSMTADGLRETFVLDSSIFDAARRIENPS